MSIYLYICIGVKKGIAMSYSAFDLNDPNYITNLVKAFESNKIRANRIVIKARKVPEMDMSNPNPTFPFQGLNNRWYKIGVPDGHYNCYLFAMGWPFSTPNLEVGLPGVLSTMSIPSSKDAIVDFITSDLAQAGRDVHEVIMGQDIPERLPKAKPSTYWVKIYFVGEDLSSFHISRKDEVSGRWVHKLGWTEPPKVICDNLEFKGWYELITMYYPDFSKYPPEELESLTKVMNLPLYGSITKSRWESRDNAGYKAYEADKSPDRFIYFEPYCVMRIDE